VPLQRAFEQSQWLTDLIDSGAVYQPLAWTPTEAHRFLRAIPSFEAAGLVVRVPDWWRARRPPRPEVTVRVGEKKPSALGMDALLDFSVAVALGDQTLWAAELRAEAPSGPGNNANGKASKAAARAIRRGSHPRALDASTPVIAVGGPSRSRERHR
jgi:SNF2 helicase protein